MGELPRFEHFPHDADMGIRGIGSTVEEAFEQAARALTAVTTELCRVEPREAVSIECSAPRLDDLLYDWIDALVFEMSRHRRLFSRFEVRIDGERLTGRAWGEAVDRDRHEPAVEVKGPTLTELGVRYEPSLGAWIAQCIVDV